MKRQWVVIRGLGREAEHSKEFLDKLKKADVTASVKCIDLPGAGEFYKLSSPMTIEGISEFVYTQLKNEVFDERYIIAISLGAMVATALFKNYPHIAQGAVLTNTSFANLSPIYTRLQKEAYMHLYRALTAVSMEERERAILDMVSNRDDRHMYIESWAQIARARPINVMNFLKQLLAASMYELQKNKPPISILVLSSAQDRMVHPSCSKALSEYWHLPLEVHPTAGHELWLDDPDWVIKKTINFFNSPHT